MLNSLAVPILISIAALHPYNQNNGTYVSCDVLPLMPKFSALFVTDLLG